MLEWRKTTDENLRMKDEKIAEQQKKAQKGEKELQEPEAISTQVFSMTTGSSGLPDDDDNSTNGTMTI